MKQKTLDKESKAFIAWVNKELSNPFKYFLMSVIAVFVLIFCLLKRKNFLSRLDEKLYVGGLEHGRPYYEDTQKIINELVMEFLDIIGWLMIYRWQKIRKDRLSNIASHA